MLLFPARPLLSAGPRQLFDEGNDRGEWEPRRLHMPTADRVAAMKGTAPPGRSGPRSAQSTAGDGRLTAGTPIWSLRGETFREALVQPRRASSPRRPSADPHARSRRQRRPACPAPTMPPSADVRGDARLHGGAARLRRHPACGAHPTSAPEIESIRGDTTLPTSINRKIA